MFIRDSFFILLIIASGVRRFLIGKRDNGTSNIMMKISRNLFRKEEIASTQNKAKIALLVCVKNVASTVTAIIRMRGTLLDGSFT